MGDHRQIDKLRSKEVSIFGRVKSVPKKEIIRIRLDLARDCIEGGSGAILKSKGDRILNQLREERINVDQAGMNAFGGGSSRHLNRKKVVGRGYEIFSSANRCAAPRNDVRSERYIWNIQDGNILRSCCGELIDAVDYIFCRGAGVDSGCKIIRAYPDDILRTG